MKSHAVWIGPFAEMAQIGVERLGAGDREKHRAERHETDDAVMEHERDREQRLSARKISGCCMIGVIDAIAITANQMHITGPKNAAPVPCRATVPRTAQTG